ncbi:MAG: hypothetical protein MJZ28_03670 [Paludibacteraceae bacterium]|nr:hypothetical protein [Paludibacteraceae bacterium]
MEDLIIIKENSILITESTVLDWYKKITNNQEVPQEEMDAILRRFRELVNYRNTNGTRMP